MKKWWLLTLVPLLVGALIIPVYASDVVYINKDEGGFVPITKVTLVVNGVIDEQSASTADGTFKEKTGGTINLFSLEVNDGGFVTVTPFNTSGAAVYLEGFEFFDGNGNVGVLKPDGNRVTLKDNKAAFRDEAEKTFRNLNLNNYIYSEGTENLPSAGDADYRVMYEVPLKADDYLVVMERWGNSYFKVKPLDAAGNVIAGSKTLHFGESTWSDKKVFDWNTGYAHNSYETDQSYWLMVAKVSQFFSGSGSDVYGLAIENKGEADIKLFTFRLPEKTPCAVYTQGYWRNKGYKIGWPALPVIEGHRDISYNDFFGQGSWMKVLTTPPKGDAYYILASQFIAAFLNMQLEENEGCYIPCEVMDAFTKAKLYFHANGPGVLGGGRLSRTNRALRTKVIGWAGILDDWNNGLYYCP